MASYNLNLIPGDAPVVVHVNQYDYGYPIDFTVYDGDTVFSLSGYAAVINIGKADRNVYVGGTVTLRGNTATVTLEEQMTAMWGPCIAEIVFTNINGRRATANFILDIEKSPLEDGAESESVINYIEDAKESTIAATEAAYEAATAASNAVGAAQSAADAAAGSPVFRSATPRPAAECGNTCAACARRVSAGRRNGFRTSCGRCAAPFSARRASGPTGRRPASASESSPARQ